MLNIKTKNRLSVLVAISALSIVLVVFIFKTLEDNVLYFYSPSEIESNNKISYKSDIRIGGMKMGRTDDTEYSDLAHAYYPNNNNFYQDYLKFELSR